MWQRVGKRKADKKASERKVERAAMISQGFCGAKGGGGDRTESELGDIFGGRRVPGLRIEYISNILAAHPHKKMENFSKSRKSMPTNFDFLTTFAFSGFKMFQKLYQYLEQSLCRMF